MSVSEPVVMPRYGNSPGRVVVVGMIRSGPLRIGRRRPRTFYGRVDTAAPGVELAPDPVVSHACGTWKPRQVHHARVCGGRPTVREAESRGGNRTPKKRTPVAERQQETEPVGRRSLQPVGSWITGRIPGLVPGCESRLTCGG